MYIKEHPNGGTPTISSFATISLFFPHDNPMVVFYLLPCTGRVEIFYLSGLSVDVLESSQLQHLQLFTETGVDALLADDVLWLRLVPISNGIYPNSLKYG